MKNSNLLACVDGAFQQTLATCRISSWMSFLRRAHPGKASIIYMPNLISRLIIYSVFHVNNLLENFLYFQMGGNLSNWNNNAFFNLTWYKSKGGGGSEILLKHPKEVMYS